MRTLILVGCGVFAAACASNKPPEGQDPARYSSQESASATSTTATPSTNNGSQTWTAEPTPTTGNERTSANTDMASPRAAGRTGPRPGDSTLGTVRDPAVENPPPGPATDPAPGTEPDNTGINKRDKSSAALTPMDQGNGDGDLKLTQDIRKAVMADSSLSFTAKNVKIITAKGKVTLRGPVKTDHERQVIGDQARKIAGAANVDDQLEVTK